MKEIKENISNNIVELRKKMKWTQAELASKLNYTDKAISKWERGESTPDVDALYKMSEIFGVTVDYFFHEDSHLNISNYSVPKGILQRRIAQLALILTSIWFVAVVIFVYSYISDTKSPDGMWLAFIWAVPICCIVTLLYFNKIKLLNAIPYVGSCFLWSLLASIYLNGIVLGENIWLIFLTGIPIQIAIVIGYWLKK